MSLRHLTLVALLVSAFAVSPAAAADNGYFPRNPYDTRFCAGLETAFRTGNGTRLDCTSKTTAIVVEYFDYWPQAIGQALALATETGRQPGIVLVCRNDRQHCASAGHDVESVFGRLRTPLTLWPCAMTDAWLGECYKAVLPSLLCRLPLETRLNLSNPLENAPACPGLSARQRMAPTPAPGIGRFCAKSRVSDAKTH